jgi:hypothetical protein
VRALYAAGCDEICISLNTAYAAMMRTTPKNYGRVLDNVRRAAAIKRGVGAVTCCIPQDHKTAVLGSVHSASLSEIWLGPSYARFRAELREVMARRGEIAGADLARSCVIEPLCAQKDACPNRSYYWTGDLAFRRQFHRMVEELSVPEGDAFAGITGGMPRENPSRLPALPVR